MTETVMRVCYFGTYRDDHPRNQNMIAGLRSNGVQVVECHVSLWKGIEYRVKLASGGWKNLEFAWRIVKTYILLIIKYLKNGKYDVLVVGYPGQFDVFLAWLLSRLRGKPLCWDIIMSIYLVAKERQLDRFSPFTIRLIKLIERISCKLPDLMILESDEYVNWFHEVHNASINKFVLVPLSVDQEKYYPLDDVGIPENPFLVVYFGSFIPNHGIDVILNASQLLQHETTIQFEFIGVGPELDSAKKFVRQNEIKNVTFSGWLEQNDFFKHLTRANLCLGVFGDTPQSMMTIQHKILECLAMRKPLITGESPLISRTFIHKKHMYICSRMPDALATGILELRNISDLRQKIAFEGYQHYTNHFTIQINGEIFKRNLFLKLLSI